MAIVVILPQKVHLTRLSVIGTGCDFFDVSNLHLEDLVFKAMATVLFPRYDVVRTTVDDGAYIKSSNSEYMGMFKSFPPAGEQVKEFTHSEKPADYYLVFSSSPLENICAVYPVPHPGYGIGVTRIFQSTNLHAFAGALLVDAKTLAVSPPIDAGPSYIPLPEFDWQDKWADLSDAQRKSIMGGLAVLISSEALTVARRILPSS